MKITTEDRRRLAGLILNAWTLGEDLDTIIHDEEEGLDPDSEYERKEFEENKRVVEMDRGRASLVLWQLEGFREALKDSRYRCISDETLAELLVDDVIDRFLSTEYYDLLEDLEVLIEDNLEDEELDRLIKEFEDDRGEVD